ncbi:MAG: ABC transporter permease [Chloroflexota bacterium]|nr:ABC transporter permease [Chloroflexota bacterium]
MKKIWLVLKTEFINTVTRRSFILTLILVPLIPALILGGMALFGGNDNGGQGEITQPEQSADVAEGYVDQADIITKLPDWIDQGRLMRYDSEDAARRDTQSGVLQAYYVIPADYLETGAIRYVRTDFNPLTAMNEIGIINAVIEYNLLGADDQRYSTYLNPVQVQPVDLTPGDQGQISQSDNPLAFYLPYGVTMLFYALILSSASLMLNSVAKEKENRVMEILLSSVKPTELLAGKILGLGLVGLLQLVVWMGSALYLLRIGGGTLNIPAGLEFPPQLLLWGILFFVLGYLLYAGFMAGVGALVPNLREATQATTVIVLPMIIPLMLVGVIIEQPSAPLPTILSLFPLTGPTTMMTRLAAGPVPLWQLILSAGLLLGTVILIIRAVARMFRAQTLLTGKKFSLGLYIKVLLGKGEESLDTTSG